MIGEVCVKLVPVSSHIKISAFERPFVFTLTVLPFEKDKFIVCMESFSLDN